MSANSKVFPIVTQSKEEDELHRIQGNTCLMTDQSLRVTQEMLRIARECEDAGAATLSMLHEQGDQLRRTDAALDGIHVGLKEAEDDLIKMKRTQRFCGCFKSWCLCCSRSKETNENIWEKKVTASTPTVRKQTMKSPSTPRASERLIPRITNDAKEDQMETNMQGLGNVLGNMKHIAISMGTEIGKQNSDLDSMSQKTQSNQIRINSVQKTADSVLKS